MTLKIVYAIVAIDVLMMIEAFSLMAWTQWFKRRAPEILDAAYTPPEATNRESMAKLSAFMEETRPTFAHAMPWHLLRTYLKYRK